MGRLGVHEADVDDLTHEVLLVARRSLESFRGDAQTGTWLFAIARNVVSTRRRDRDRRTRLFSTFSAMEEHAATLGAPGADEGAPALAEQIMRALGQLPPHHLSAIWLSLIERRPTEEVAARLGVPTTTLRIWIHRARKRLVRSLGPVSPS
jgi:RNA polymerase sigma-70 factor (ECF subfamily)